MLFILCFTSCTSVKIGMFRGVMNVFGAKIYRSRFIALNDPKFIPLDEAGYLKDEDEVIGIFHNGIVKAYPLTMSFHHHIFNDEIGGKRILVTFCPLTHTAMVFDPVVDGESPMKFIVEGGLKESNMIMLDDLTQSRWIQITAGAIAGRMKGKRLDLLFALHTTWNEWKRLHPNTVVLSRETGFDYDYSQFPFQEKYFRYKKTEHFMFKVSHQDDRYHPKELMLVVEVGDSSKVYPFSNLKARGAINDWVAQAPIVVFYDTISQTITAFSRKFNGDALDFSAEADSNCVRFKDSMTHSSWNFEGMAYEGACKGKRLDPVRSFKSFWFAWIAFHPETEIYGVK
jgi:hypothetical protein